MEFIAHRVNTIEELKKTPHEYGIELDLRDRGERLILQHDPFKDGEDFEDYLKHYKHGTMILNIKSERIEWRVLELVRKYNIKRYFFLDCSFPMITQLINQGESNIALRYSEYEAADTIFNLQGKVKWIWVDCFTKPPLDANIYQLFKSNNFKLCLVSPELQGRPEDVQGHKDYYQNQHIEFDAICAKIYKINEWK